MRVTLLCPFRIPPASSRFMLQLRIGGRPISHGTEYRARYVFSWLTLFSTVALLAWGAFVTSINAGLAVPDWPTTFQSYDPFNPWPDWWTITPVLAEHGHRLLGMLVGLMTMILAIWTFAKDDRRWMRILAVSALVLVIFQGVLGGLRVVLVSLNLAMIHAAVAQIYFSTIAAMVLFTSRPWLDARGILPQERATLRFRVLALITVCAVFLQIVLGVFLRHPGTGLDPLLAGLHIAGGLSVAALMIAAFVFARRSFDRDSFVMTGVRWMLGFLIAQIALGFTAYFVILDEAGVLQPSNVQVVVNSAHLVIGAFLMASAVLVALISLRVPTDEPASTRAEVVGRTLSATR